MLHEDGVVKLPGYLTDEEGATLPIAAVTAWQALVIAGGLRATLQFAPKEVAEIVEQLVA